MKVLAIDTSSDICSVALLENDDLLDEINLNNGKTHSENLLCLIDEILNKNSISLSDINLISCIVGPGSFTGIRIGVSTIKAMSEVNNIPLASVTALESLSISDCSNKNKVVLIDAKNDQVYCGIFNSNYEKLCEYIADDIHTVLEKCSEFDNLIFIGNGSIIHKDLINESLKDINFCNEINQKAFYAGKIGYRKFLKGEVTNADNISPIYLRKSQAERIKDIKGK